MRKLFYFQFFENKPTYIYCCYWQFQRPVFTLWPQKVNSVVQFDNMREPRRADVPQLGQDRYRIFQEEYGNLLLFSYGDKLSLFLSSKAGIELEIWVLDSQDPWTKRNQFSAIISAHGWHLNWISYIFKFQFVIWIYIKIHGYCFNFEYFICL